ncbi:GNAT family N-acetyltransferase [Gluconacetobacter sp. 1b LMG 1731]|uniref:GNAT family N-acetyltransferase n=1 Tax=Gluconacetobacter dulcium TaxID=2729096 RepID=A0A7W4IP60_9PROT|nr:GNAT family N-acetyltransferase [Gluconacetobacter dulcium]MBB2166369.1 GNAT family N-acetyltransferase [Gluconacetobacter dulcium]MBB2195465.1 GNAT family N-acetyltransferase [Gluconacetobacter dulcium]
MLPLDKSIDLPESYSIQDAVPGVEEYLRLRRVSGLAPRTAPAAEAGLPNSLFSVCVRQGAHVVGMGRVIGDGALFLHIVDVAVDPHHQGQGLGKAIVAALMRHIARTVPAETYVSLMANGEAFHLYEQFGFAAVTPEARGMALWVKGPS